MSQNLSRLFVEQLRKKGLSDEDIALIGENPLVAQSAAIMIGGLCLKIRAIVRPGSDQEEGGFEADLRQARLILNKSGSDYEIRTLAALIKLTREEPHNDPSITDVSRVLAVSRQAVSRSLRKHQIDFVLLKRRVP